MLRITNLYLSIPIEKATSHNLTINWKHANMTKTNLTLGRKLIWVKSKGTPPMPEVLGVALGGTANWCAPSATAPWFQWDTEGYNNYTYTYSPKNGVISMRSKTNMFIQRSLKNIGGIKLNVSIIHIHHSFCAFPRFLLRKESVILGLLFFLGGVVSKKPYLPPCSLSYRNGCYNQGTTSVIILLSKDFAMQKRFSCARGDRPTAIAFLRGGEATKIPETWNLIPWQLTMDAWKTDSFILGLRSKLWVIEVIEAGIFGKKTVHVYIYKHQQIKRI